MSNLLAVLMDGVAQIEYRRDVPLTPVQQQFLERMDGEMDGGVQVGEQQIHQPDETQRAQFVALQLVQALLDSDEQRIAASCAYLAVRMPELKQLKAETHASGVIGIEMVFNESYSNQVKVSFSTAPKNSLH